MNIDTYKKIEAEMLRCMEGDDSAHDAEHVYRVLSIALILSEDSKVDMDVLIAAVLLHDIGRALEEEDEAVDHAAIGAVMAYDFLIAQGFSPDKALHVKACIATHRYSKGNRPATLEAQILFDADKLDLTGTMAIMRGIISGYRYHEPLYVVDKSGNIRDGTDRKEVSFVSFFNRRLREVSQKLFTDKAKNMAEKRLEIAEAFYNSLLVEIRDTRKYSKEILNRYISE